MATTLQFRRGTAAEAAAFLGAEGELFLDIENVIMYIHDGVTAGGKPMANFNQLTLDTVTSQGATTTNDLTVNDFTVNGNLQVLGTSTTVNTVQMDIFDKNITIGSSLTSAAEADGGGLTLNMGTDGDAHLNYDNANAAWSTNKSIIPAADNVYDLGTADRTFRHIFVGPGSLYVNGQQVITDDSGTITVSADPDQNLQFKTQGAGDLQLVTGVGGTITVAGTMQITNGYNITDSAGVAVKFGDAIDMNGNTIGELGTPVLSDDAATKAYVDTQVGSISQSSILEGNSNVSVNDTGTGSVVVTIDGATALEVTSAGVEIVGNLIVGGPTTTLQSNALSIFDNIITLNADATGAPTESVGVEVERGDVSNTSIRWNESSDTWTFTNNGANYFPIPTSTADLQETGNLYYTDARVRAAISATGDLGYNASTGEFSYTETDDLDSVTARGAVTANAVTVGDLQVNGNIVTTGYIGGPATMTIDPAAIGDNTGTVVIAGNLQVDGTTTTVNSATLSVADKNVIVASGSANAAASNGAGLTISLGTDGNATLTYADATDTMNFNKALYIVGNRALTTADLGAGAGLDADTLDGQQGSYYLDWTNVTNKPDPTVTLTGAITGTATMTDLGSINITTTATNDPTLTLNGDCSGSATFTNLGDATLTVTVANDSHIHSIPYIDGLDEALTSKLNAAEYTAADVIAKLLTVDGAGSGLDADLLDGQSSAYYATASSVSTLSSTKLDASAYTAADVLAKLLTVDGSGSGLDADLLDGQSIAYFAPQSTTYTKTEVDNAIAGLVDSAPGTLDTLNELAAALGDDPNFATTITTQIGTKLDSASYTAADVLAKIKTVDGAGSGLDADLLDGQSSAYYATATHNHTLDSLSNTTITSNSAGEILKWNGSAWVNNTLAEAGIQAAGSYITTATAFGGDVSGTYDAIVVADDSHTHDTRYYTETEMDSLLAGKSDTTHNHTLDSLSNTTITSNSAGEILKWNGTAWVNNTLAEAGIQAAGSYITTATAFGGDVSGTYNAIVVADDSHNHTGSTASFTVGTDLTVSGGDIVLGGTGRIQGIDTVSVDTDAANKLYVDTAISNLVSSAPTTLDTLNELAAALGDDPNFATTVTTALGLKLNADHDMTLTLNGNVSGSATFVDMGNATLTVTVADDSHTHDTRYYTETESDGRFFRLGAANTHTGDILPSTSNTYNLGSATYKYAQIHATTFYGTATTAQYADLAEKYTVEGTPVAGQVIVIGGEVADCTVSNEVASQAVLGVVSTDPAFMMNSDSDGEYIALKGRVPCKVNGPVAKGEPLVSGPNGCAVGINSIDPELAAKPGIIFGKALDSNVEGEATIEVVVL